METVFISDFDPGYYGINVLFTHKPYPLSRNVPEHSNPEG
jgi:hypothetical protein